MVKPNTNFELSVNDIDLIEQALHFQINRLLEQRRTHVESTIIPEDQLTAVVEIDNETNKLRDLLGKIHNQKVWYRPSGVYISG